MRRWTLLALLAALFVVGCGKTVTSPTSAPVKTPAPFVCHPQVPAQMGECIREQLAAKGVALVSPMLAGRPGGAQCVDISVYQGVPNFRASGVRCVIIQTNDGGFRNSLFLEQVRAAKRAGIPWGVYSFLAPGVSGEAQVNLALAMSNGLGRTLGVWADAEVSGSYEHACAYTARARALHVNVFGVYSSPGLWPGYHCIGAVWPAEWGSGAAYPLPGYPRSAILFRQWCGTCSLSGIGSVDRDENLGLLTFAHSAPTPAQQHARWKRELDVAYVLRNELHVDIDRHHCRLSAPTFGHAKPPSYHTLCARWLAHGQVEVQRIKAFHAKGVF
jgi:hypothetical protein